MKNLMRAVRMACRYKYSLMGSIVCSALVALFWGANISAVYPFIEIVFQGKTLHQWVAEDIDRLQLQRKEITLRQQQLADRADPALAVLAAQRTSLEKKLARKRTLQRYVARYAPHDAFRTLQVIIVFLLLGTLLKCVFRISSLVLVARVAGRTTVDIQGAFFRSILSDRAQAARRIGDAAGRVGGDAGAIGAAIQTIFGRSIQEPMKMFTCLAGAAVVNWRLLVFSLVTCPLASLLLVWLARSIRRASHRSFDQTCMLISRMVQTVQGLHVVKAYNMESHERRRFWQHALRVYREQLKIAFFGGLVRTNNEVLGIGVLCLSVLAGGYLVLNQKTHLLGIPLASDTMDFGQIMLFFAFLIGCTDPLRKIADVYGTIQGGAAAADRIFPWIDAVQQATRQSTDRDRLPHARRDLIFENVQFHYPSGKPVLRGVSFRVRNGETLAIVGANGCGKTTLINLLLRFLDPTAGSIRLGDTDLRQIRPKDLRRRIALVTQQPVLFDDTVANNIRYGSRRASPQQIRQAAEKAHAHRFVEDLLQHGYHTACGEFGKRLSGGQRQRLALARAILRDPDILILDEATSQIDPTSEELIQQSLQQFKQGRTVLMITHRLSALPLADRILVMDAGLIVGLGTHAELMDRCPAYRALHATPLRMSA